MADPAGVFINIALQAAISLIIALLTPKQRNEGPRLDDRQITTSTYGEEVVIGYGTVICGGNVIWGKDLIEVAETVEIGKGSIFSLGTNTTYYYFATFAVGLARRQVEAIIRIYADGKVIYDAEAENARDRKMPGLNFNFYKGTQTQGRDPIIAADVGEENCPAYRGVAYIVFNRMPLEDFGNRIPQLRFVLAFKSSEEGRASYQYDGGGDVNSTQNYAVYEQVRQVSFNTRTISGTKYLCANSIWDGSLFMKKSVTSLGLSNTTGYQVWGGYAPKCPYLIMSNDGGRQIFLIDKDTLESLDSTKIAPSLQRNWNVFDDLNSVGSRQIFVRCDKAQTIEVTKGLQSKWFVATIGEDQSGILPGAGAAVLQLTDEGFEWEEGSGSGDYQLGTDFRHAGGVCQGAQREGETDIYMSFSNTALSEAYLLKHSLVPPYEEPLEDDTSNGFSTNPLITRGEGATVQALYYDPATDILVWAVGTNVRAYFMDSANGNDGLEELWQVTGAAWAFPGENHEFQNSEFYPEGVMRRIGSDGIDYEIDLQTGVVTQLETGFYKVSPPVANKFTAGDGIEMNTDHNGIIYDAEFDVYVGVNRGAFFMAPLATRQGETLSSVVSDIVTRGRLTASDIDVQQLSSKQVRGYLIGKGMSYRNALEPLATAYNFYGVEKNGEIFFDFHKTSTDKVIPEDDLIRSDNENIFEEARGQELETPRALYLTHRDPNADDNKMVQGARRITLPDQTMSSVGEKTLEIPLWIEAEEGAQICERILFDSWVQRESVRFRLPPRYMDILPNDVLEVTAEGRTENIRVNRNTLGANLEVEIDGNVIDGEVYTQRVGGVTYIGSPNFTPPRLSAVNPFVQGFFLDMPLLDDGHLTDRVTGLIYFSAGVGALGGGTAFAGAQLLTSYEGDDLRARTGLAGDGACWGIVDGSVPNSPGIDWNAVQEETITVTVFAQEGQLSSVDEDVMIKTNANAAALLKANGEVEIINFRDVTNTTDNTYELTGLMRGRRGTNHVGPDIASYTGTIYFILLTTETVTAFVEQLVRDEATVTYRTVPNSEEASNARDRTQTVKLRTLMPYAPSHVQMAVNSDDRTISWTRRTRQGGEWRDEVDVPLAEDSEAYEVDILDAEDGNVLRTLSSSSESVSYSQTQADIDFGTEFPNPLHVKVYQVSAQVGRGFPAAAALMEE